MSVIFKIEKKLPNLRRRRKTVEKRPFFSFYLKSTFRPHTTTQRDIYIDRIGHKLSNGIHPYR